MKKTNAESVPEMVKRALDNAFSGIRSNARTAIELVETARENFDMTHEMCGDRADDLLYAETSVAFYKLKSLLQETVLSSSHEPVERAERIASDLRVMGQARPRALKGKSGTHRAARKARAA